MLLYGLMAQGQFEEPFDRYPDTHIPGGDQFADSADLSVEVAETTYGYGEYGDHDGDHAFSDPAAFVPGFQENDGYEQFGDAARPVEVDTAHASAPEPSARVIPFPVPIRPPQSETAPATPVEPAKVQTTIEPVASVPDPEGRRSPEPVRTQPPVVESPTSHREPSPIPNPVTVASYPKTFIRPPRPVRELPAYPVLTRLSKATKDRLDFDGGMVKFIAMATANSAMDMADKVMRPIERVIPALGNKKVRNAVAAVAIAGAGAAVLYGIFSSLKSGDTSPLTQGVPQGPKGVDPSQLLPTGGSGATVGPTGGNGNILPPPPTSSTAAEVTSTVPLPTSTGSQPPLTTGGASGASPSSPPVSPPSPTTPVTPDTPPPGPSNPNTGGGAGNPNTGGGGGGPTNFDHKTVQAGDNVYKMGREQIGLDNSQIEEGIRDGSITAHHQDGSVVKNLNKLSIGDTVDFANPPTTPPLPDTVPSDALTVGQGGTVSDTAPYLLKDAGMPVNTGNIQDATEAIFLFNQDMGIVGLDWDTAHLIHSTYIDGASVATFHGQVLHTPPVAMMEELMERAKELSRK